MAKTKPVPPKIEALRRHGSLNPHPGRVQDPLFATSDFFDARDVVQVKYELTPAYSGSDKSHSQDRHQARRGRK